VLHGASLRFTHGTVPVRHDRLATLTPMTSAPAAPSRSRRIVGIVVGVLLALAALSLAFGIYATFFGFRDPSGALVASCTAAQTATQCNQGYLDLLCYIGYAICLFGWGVPIGFMVARMIQKRRAWPFPVISIAVVYIGYFVLTALIGSGYLK
jgi:hypothetical protein